MAKIENFMNNRDNDLSVDNVTQAKGYFRKMKDLYHKKLS
jgi:ferritin